MFTTTVRKLCKQPSKGDERECNVIEVTKKFLGITYSRVENYIY